MTYNCTVVVTPLETTLEVVVAGEDAKDVVAEDPVFCVGDVVDARHVQANGEQSLPTSDWVRPHDRVRWREIVAYVERRSARLDDRVASSISRGLENRLMARRSESLEVPTEGGRDAVVDLV